MRRRLDAQSLAMWQTLREIAANPTDVTSMSRRPSCRIYPAELRPLPQARAELMRDHGHTLVELYE
jgi:hypothetical protein